MQSAMRPLSTTVSALLGSLGMEHTVKVIETAQDKMRACQKFQCMYVRMTMHVYQDTCTPKLIVVCGLMNIIHKGIHTGILLRLSIG